jgi:hypothetical protein
LGCPIAYYPMAEKSIDRDRLTEKFQKLNFPCDKLDFFETEGIFCSFPCIKRYIKKQNMKALYKNSMALLSLMHLLAYGTVVNIPYAPDAQKTLKMFGGHLTIEKYREGFGVLEYTETCNWRRPYLFCSARYIEERKVRKSEIKGQ